MAATTGSTIQITAEPRRIPTPARRRSMAARRAARVEICRNSTLAAARDVRWTEADWTGAVSLRTVVTAAIVADATPEPIVDGPAGATAAGRTGSATAV